jgi:hypothetical protein
MNARTIVRAIGICISPALVLAAATLAPQLLPAAEANVGLAGHWQYDAGASDDFSARLAQLIAEQRKRQRPRGMRGVPEAERALTLPEEPPLEAADRVQARLEETLRPAHDLLIALRGSDIELTSDDEPTRTLTPGRPLARMDSSGTAQITAQWQGATLVIRARYTHRAVRLQQYSLDRRSDTLRIKLQVNDPAIGRMELQSVYRRKPPQT